MPEIKNVAGRGNNLQVDGYTRELLSRRCTAAFFLFAVSCFEVFLALGMLVELCVVQRQEIPEPGFVLSIKVEQKTTALI